MPDPRFVPAQPLTLGRMAYLGFHRPLGVLKEIIRTGGLADNRQDQEGREAMRQSIKGLPPPPSNSGAPLRVHLLTGSRFWDQTVFCLYSFSRHTRRNLSPLIFDDGTLNESNKDEIKRLFPLAEFPSLDSVWERLETHLPIEKFPVLRERWTHYPNLRKLVDPHLGFSGWKLVIDSDLLFFHPPLDLVEWLDSPQSPLHAVDVIESYGYPRSAMEKLSGHDIADKLNVGLCGLNSDQLDWEQLEFWTDQLQQEFGTSYYLEQALGAMLMAGKSCKVLSPEQYITGPSAPEDKNCEAIMHHYVADSKRAYFRTNWRKFLPNQTT